MPATALDIFTLMEVASGDTVAEVLQNVLKEFPQTSTADLREIVMQKGLAITGGFSTQISRARKAVNAPVSLSQVSNEQVLLKAV